jgi:4-aminobutyrate aminotransferase-like enzyme
METIKRKLVEFGNRRDVRSGAHPVRTNWAHEGRGVDPDLVNFAKWVFDSIPLGETVYDEDNEVTLKKVATADIEASCLLSSMSNEVQQYKLQQMGYRDINQLKQSLVDYGKAAGYNISFSRS